MFIFLTLDWQVSIIGATSCRYIFWPRQALEYLLIKEPYLANLMNIIIGRDIATKLYALNDKVFILNNLITTWAVTECVCLFNHY